MWAPSWIKKKKRAGLICRWNKWVPMIWASVIGTAEWPSTPILGRGGVWSSSMMTDAGGASCIHHHCVLPLITESSESWSSIAAVELNEKCSVHFGIQLTAVVFERESGRTMIVLEQEPFKIPKKILKLQGVNLKSEGVNLSSEGPNLCFLHALPYYPQIPPEIGICEKNSPRVFLCKMRLSPWVGYN